jgi:purine-binding chemotaxis protein CheW
MEPDKQAMTGAIEHGADEIQVVTFVLAHEEFGVPIALVKEIVNVPAITRIPRAPVFVEGVANLRGSILPVVNLRRRFDLPTEERNEDNVVVVIEIGGRLTGLVVDQVSEVLRVANESIEPPPPVITATIDEDYLRGVAKLQDGKRLVILLDIEKVIPSAELAANLTAQASGTGQGSATVAQTRRQAAAEEQFVSFTVADEEYAVMLGDVQEIIRVPAISRVPRAPAFIEGVVALRNRLLPIINLRKRFGLEVIELNEEDNRIIVVSLRGVITGMLVDAVTEVLSVPKDAIEPPPAILSNDESDQLRGVAKLEEGKRLIMLLDISRVLSSSEISQLASLGAEGQEASSGEARRQAIDEQQYVSFRVEHEEFGVSIQQVQEIIWLPDITRVPRAPHFVEGIINLRGSVLPVIDMRKRFGIPEAPRTDSTSIVVVDVEGRKTGVIVDSVSEVLRLGRDSIEPPPPVVAGVEASFIEGVGKLQGGQRMLIILNLPRVLSMEAAAA